MKRKVPPSGTAKATETLSGVSRRTSRTVSEWNCGLTPFWSALVARSPSAEAWGADFLNQENIDAYKSRGRVRTAGYRFLFYRQ